MTHHHYEQQMSTVPPRVAKLPQDRNGYPVPWFVAWINGVPDFRVMDGNKLVAAIRHDFCWVCGEPLGANKTFVIGPMCAVNRTSAEPPSHRDCAIFSATHCPFLVNPKKRRREQNKPEGTVDPAGVMIARNPGVALVWSTRSHRVERVDDGVLFDIGEPTEVLWFSEGREATRAEVLASIETGLPILREMAESEGQGAVDELDRLVTVAMPLVPA